MADTRANLAEVIVQTPPDRLLSGRSEVAPVEARATCGGSAGVNMNKRELIDAVSGRLGDKKSATEAVNAVLETIQSAVAAGDKVAITGFGEIGRAHV